MMFVNSAVVETCAWYPPELLGHDLRDRGPCRGLPVERGVGCEVVVPSEGDLVGHDWRGCSRHLRREGADGQGLLAEDACVTEDEACRRARSTSACNRDARTSSRPRRPGCRGATCQPAWAS